jgi:ribosome recycling factor
MLETLYKETTARMKKSVEAMSREFSAVRTGKATINLLDTVRVETYGTQVPLNQVATIASPEPRLLVVQAFDKATVSEIVKSIQRADMGLNPQVDGQTIRIPIPPLNEQRRKELVRHCKNVAEDGRVAVRNIRRDANEQIKKAQKDKELSEDQEKDGLAETQKLTDEAIKDIDNLLARKEKEVMEV